MRKITKTKKFRVKTEVTAISFKWYDPDGHSMAINFQSQYDMRLFLKAAESASRKYKKMFKK